MEFYSFRYGDTKAARADAASPRVVAVEMTLAFKAPERHTVETLALTVHVPDPDGPEAARREAYALARELLQAAADHCAAHSADDLLRDTEERQAFVLKS
jgi:hypothetical protein